MEITQSLSHDLNQSWFNKKCRLIVFKALNTIENAQIEVHEGNKVTLLGNKTASLKGHICVSDMSIYKDFIKGGSVDVAQAYLDEKWSSNNLTQLVRVFARSQQALDSVESKKGIMAKIKSKLLHFQNSNTQSGSKKNILAHYDLGNDLYTRFLDPTMMYSCAIYNQSHQTIDQAQMNKLDQICKKLDLKADEHLIEIGTGWGGLAIFAAQNYGCKVTTTTISDEQYNYASEKVKQLGLEDSITLLKKDYRLLEGQFDKLVSIEMIEAVGHDFMTSFFEKCNSLLKSNGKMLIQAITIADQRYDKYRKNIDFIQKYIFPGGCLPSVHVMSQHIKQSTDMMIDNVEDIGLHYARTLNDWRVNFDNNWHDIQKFGFDDTFKRLWHYYFAYCEGAFLERVISTHHIVARKPQYLDDNDNKITSYL
jgi:cyclopropane-fatty-acyl-phospholipid synthase